MALRRSALTMMRASLAPERMKPDRLWLRPVPRADTPKQTCRACSSARK